MSEHGNTAVMREALKSVIEKLLDCAPTAEREWPELVQRARAALSEPARNCDVGTVEEQWARFERQCEAHRMPTDHDYCSCTCKVDGGCVNECALIWAQMPYEAEGSAE